METHPETNRRNARIAGAIFLFVCIPLSMWGQMYVPSQIFVAQDPATTATNMLAKEFIFRTSIVVNMFGFMFFALMTLMFYKIFRPVDKQLALLMIIPVIAQVAVTFLLESLNFAALLIVKSEPRPGFDVAQQQESAYLLMRIYRAVMSCDKFLLGLSIIPWGILVWRSGFTPRVFGVLLIISGIGYLADTATGILFDRSVVVVLRPVLRGAFVGYVLTMLWMVIKSVNEKKPVLN
jgi:hypothetical protein